jgi:hypothetical protein
MKRRRTSSREHGGNLETLTLKMHVDLVVERCLDVLEWDLVAFLDILDVVECLDVEEDVGQWEDVDVECLEDVGGGTMEHLPFREQRKELWQELLMQ